MGYYTHHEFETDPPTARESVIAEIESVSGKTDLFDGDSRKWYDHQKHMIEVSKRHPNVLMILDGEGEENLDVWREFYKGGKMERHKAMWTPPEMPDDEGMR